MERSAAKIAVVEDDETIRKLLCMTLAGAGYSRVAVAARGDDGLEIAVRERPDVMLLDVMLPGLDGLSLCRRLRQNPETAAMAIIMLTAKSESEDVVAGLDAGADDYVTKPFSRSVLLARIQAVLRRLDRAQPWSELDGLRVDVSAGAATLAGATLSLTKTEFLYLSRFVAHPARVYTRRQLADIAGSSGDGERTIDVQIAGLRKKLGAWASHLETVRGVGYRVVP
jgi:two-component system phosphate regulon response regulator PhoB